MIAVGVCVEVEVRKKKSTTITTACCKSELSAFVLSKRFVVHVMNVSYSGINEKASRRRAETRGTRAHTLLFIMKNNLFK